MKKSSNLILCAIVSSESGLLCCDFSATFSRLLQNNFIFRFILSHPQIFLIQHQQLSH
ncbi:hypothetical protein GcM1_c14919o35 [Golovinomyces cichoracearum]|uniref:Uncharacterized protein n=1 Tax=Golovinomyces cichoracearum TaxID=62708 RepID=A0A420IL59_9PEZI|nr:hypothetical protein GcM1_c14919o35 [Golovinomyces cichoracearum]